MNIGIIGCGWITENAHIPTLIRLNKYKKIYIYDTDEEKVRNIVQKNKSIIGCNRIEELIFADIQVAIVATPNVTHYKYSCMLIQNGISVLCEKPITLSTNELLDIVRLKKTNNVKFIPAFVHRWREDILYLEKYLKKVNIKSINAEWIRKKGIPDRKWFCDSKLSGGGVLVDLGSHMIDICMMLANDFEVNTCCAILEKEIWNNMNGKDVEDTVSIELEMKNGILINIKLSWDSEEDTCGDRTKFVIEESDRTIMLNTLFGLSTKHYFKKNQIFINNQLQKEFRSNFSLTMDAFFDMHRYVFDCCSGSRKENVNSLTALPTVNLIERIYEMEGRKNV